MVVGRKLPFDRLSSNCPHLRRGVTLTLALSHDGRGDKRAFDRLRPNVLSRSHTAITDTPAWPKTQGVTLLRVNGVSWDSLLYRQANALRFV